MHRSFRILFAPIFALCLPCALAAQPVCTAWIRTPGATAGSAALARVRPEVHDVVCGDPFVEIHSAGISLYQFGILANPVNPGNGVHEVRLQIPRHPQPETGMHATLPSGIVGVFVNGVPIENHLEADSFEGRNLWHYDLNSPLGFDPAHAAATPPMLTQLLSDGSRHSPVIGFALDGYPIYGPWGYANAAGGALKRMRPSYRLRTIAQRTTWPDGTELTPGQYGPPIDGANPLGMFSEDYEFVDGSGDLDRFNGRFAVTPEYPQGTYAYFIATNAQGQLAFPYITASQYYGHVETEAGPLTRISTRPELVFSASSATPHADVPVTFSLEFAAHALEYVHEKPIHLIVVSEDLSEFSHIHPERNMGNSYRVFHTFVHGGHYRLYAEFTLPGEGPRIETFDLHVAGTQASPKPLSVSTKTMQSPAGFVAELTAAAPLRAGVDEILRFQLPSTAGLEPYLGAWGHFVLIGGSPRSFIHAHPLQVGQPQMESRMPHQHGSIPIATPPPDIVEVPVAFPQAGLYKLWAQFQVKGEVQVVPFVVPVEANRASRGASAVAIPEGAIRVHVGPAGFSPARLNIPAGKAATLAVTRGTQPNCAGKIVFPDLGITRDLPPGATVLVPLPAMAAKDLKFACGMGMYRGLLVVR